MSTKPVVRSVPASARAPISLSSALWRPTSSRTETISPSRETQAAPCTVRLKRFMICRFGNSRAALRIAAADGANRGRHRLGDADHVGDVLDAAQAATGAASSERRGMRASAKASSSMATSTAQPFSTGMAMTPRMSARLGDDAFGEHETAAEVDEVGRRRHHHRVGLGIDLHGDGDLLGKLPGDRRFLAAGIDADALRRHRAQRLGDGVGDIGAIGHAGHRLAVIGRSSRDEQRDCRGKLHGARNPYTDDARAPVSVPIPKFACVRGKAGERTSESKGH